MQLSTQVNNQVILFHDGSKLFITDEQAELVYKLSGSAAKGIKINGDYYTFSSMSKIINLEKYYDQYPHERPDYRPEWQVEPEEVKSLEQIVESSKRGFQGVLKGLKQFIDEEVAAKRNPKNAIATYHQKLEKYKKLYQPSK